MISYYTLLHVISKYSLISYSIYFKNKTINFINHDNDDFATKKKSYLLTIIDCGLNSLFNTFYKYIHSRANTSMKSESRATLFLKSITLTTINPDWLM